jgi:hypothetical protein
MRRKPREYKEAQKILAISVVHANPCSSLQAAGGMAACSSASLIFKKVDADPPCYGRACSPSSSGHRRPRGSCQKVPKSSCLLSGLVCAQEQAFWRTLNQAARLMSCFSKRVPKRPQRPHGHTYLTKRRNVPTVKYAGVRQASMPNKANNSAHQHMRLTL